MPDFWDTVGELFKGWKAKPSVSNHSVSNAQRELENNYNNTKRDFQKSYIATQQSYDFARRVVSGAIQDTSESADVDFWKLPDSIITLMMDVTVYAIKQENFFELRDFDFSREIPLSRQIEIKQYLEQIQLRVYDDDEVLRCFHTSFWNVLEHFLLSIKSLVYVESKSNSFKLDVTYALDNLPYNVEQMVISFFSEKNGQYQIFSDVCSQLLNNADVASGFKLWRSEIERDEKPCTLPTKSKLPQNELIPAYLGDTYLTKLFETKIDFSIPVGLRMEHCHILAGTGHGKTQLLQKLILEDIEAKRGFMVIDSQGDMIRKISMLKVFDSLAYESLSEKLIIIDPEDVEYPASLNMFALSDGSASASPLQKQMLINSTIDLYEYMFGALFGAEMTSKQGVIFRYVAKLMAEIPNATIHTLRNLLEDGKKYQKYIDRLDGSSKAFFETQFFTTSFGQTKKQILSRLWAVLSNQTLENLFSSTENSIDLFNAISDEKIVLVNTSKQLLQSSGSQVLGRFFIALASQAVIKRATVPEANRKPYMVYVDEAQEYFDEKLEQMLNQARKYNIGFTLSHQNLGQLGHLKHTVFSSTSIKLAGGISAKDAKEMAGEMKCSSDFLLGMEKGRSSTEFGCYLKNKTNTSIPLSFEYGLLENKGVMSANAYKVMIENIREKYCTHISEINYGHAEVDEHEMVKEKSNAEKFSTEKVEHSLIEPTKQNEKSVERQYDGKESSAVEAQHENLGGGGVKHRYLQNLVKKLGQDRGFYSVIESPVFDGHGSVDVSLEGYDKKIAIEVSVTTAGKWEGSNIAKCFSAGYDEVIIISSEGSHLREIEQEVSAEFPNEIIENRLLFFQIDDLINHLDKIKNNSVDESDTVEGYSVTVGYTEIDPQERKIREDAIARILADS